MRRREFITFFGTAVVLPTLFPFSVRAQQTERPLVGVILSGSVAAFADRIAAFRKGLSETGYIEGQNVVVEYHGMDGQYDDLPPTLDDLIRRRVAVIATPGSNPASLAAKATTATVPIVFGVAEDPVALGLVASLAHPGGNATGINFFAHETDAKRLGLMHELLPTASRFAALINPTNVSSVQRVSKKLKEAADALGLTVIFFFASNSGEIDAAFAAFAREKCDALFIAGDGFFAGRQTQFATLAARDRIPASYFSRDLVEGGLLMSYGTSVVDTFRQVGIYTGSILKGAKPIDLPVLQSTKFEFVINLQTARSLGIEIPPMLLARADEVID
jgi:putative tryptophan/tyrosine transport system substrate-binding protein